LAILDDQVDAFYCFLLVMASFTSSNNGLGTVIPLQRTLTKSAPSALGDMSFQQMAASFKN